MADVREGEDEPQPSPSRGFLDLRGTGERKKHTVPRKARRVFVAGLDGAGKTRLCTALSDPCNALAATARTVPTDIHLTLRKDPDAIPCLVHEVDDRWLVKRTDGAAFPTAPLRVPPTTRVELFDVPGAAAHRILWTPMVTGELPLSDDDHAGSTTPDALVFAIAAHDAARLPLAWTELVELARAVPSCPIIISVLQIRSLGLCMSPADVLKAVEDWQELPRVDNAPWTVTAVDLRPLEHPPDDGCVFPPVDLRRLSQWLVQAMRA